MYLIIPVKPFGQSKSRLASVLSSRKRADMSRSLLLRTVRLTRKVGQVVVISRDQTVRRLAKQAGAWALVESGTGLNKAVRQATDWVIARQGQAVLILPNDLPLLRLFDLTEIVRVGQQASSVVIAPCHRSRGTNALLVRPPDLIEFAFGSDSFVKHQQAAFKVGLEPIIYRSPTIAFDLDYPEDLEKLRPELFKAQI